jgi:hypothetical protein
MTVLDPRRDLSLGEREHRHTEHVHGEDGQQLQRREDEKRNYVRL